MRYDNNRKLAEMLAADYVLGTLRGAARQRYERLAQARPDWQQAANIWADRLHLLADTVPAVQPSTSVWQAIEKRIYGTDSSVSVSSSIASWWRMLALASSTLALALALFIVIGLPHKASEPLATKVALLADAQAKPGWILSLSKDKNGQNEIHVTTLASLNTQPGKSYELWLLPPDQAKPVALGLLPQQGNRQMKIAANLAIMLASSGLAVSVEPPGGSPTGQPTGAVLYQGKLTQI